MADDFEIRAVTQVLRSMVCALVDIPSQVKITSNVQAEAKLVTFSVKVADADLGKVIGKQGRTARCIRVIIAATARKTGWRTELDVIGKPKESREVA